MGYDDLEMFYEKLGEQKKYHGIIQRILQLYPAYLSQHSDDTYRRMAFAVTLAKADKFEEAKAEGSQALALSAGDPVMMYYGACLYARLQEKKLAVESLRNAVSSGYGNFDWIKRDPDFDSIRNEPEYIELMKGR